MKTSIIISALALFCVIGLNIGEVQARPGKGKAKVKAKFKAKVKAKVKAPAPGMKWVPAHRTASGHFVPGHWQPVKRRSGYAWVRGHRNHRGNWIKGYWRTVHRPGYTWVSGYFNGRGDYIAGHWRATPKRYVKPIIKHKRAKAASKRGHRGHKLIPRV